MSLLFEFGVFFNNPAKPPGLDIDHRRQGQHAVVTGRNRSRAAVVEFPPPIWQWMLTSPEPKPRAGNQCSRTRCRRLAG